MDITIISKSCFAISGLWRWRTAHVWHMRFGLEVAFPRIGPGQYLLASEEGGERVAYVQTGGTISSRVSRI